MMQINSQGSWAFNQCLFNLEFRDAIFSQNQAE